MNKKLLTTSVFLATSIAMAFEPWIGFDTPTPYYVNTGLDNGTNTAGYWFVATDESDGGKSKVVWPVATGNELNENSLDPIIDFCKGACGTADLDKGTLTYNPFVSVGFNVVGEGAEGDPAPGDASSWGGICITYRSDAAPSLELGLGSFDAQIGYALPAKNLNKSKNGESYKKCIPWSDFKQPSWYKGTTKISGTEAAAQLVSINFKMQGSPGQYKFNICAIGPYGDGTGKGLPETCSVPLTHPAISVNAKWSKGNDGYDATITVKDGEKELTKGTDYEIETSVNDATGIVIKTITGKGDYTGSVVKSLVPYIDENGEPQVMYDATVLTNNKDGVTELSGGWYVATGKVNMAGIKFNGEAHLILADDAEMVIETGDEYGIYASNNLTIYGQNGQSGILNDTAKGTNGSGIYSWSDITISGGTVTASGSSYGISSDNGVTISGGSVTASGYYDGIYGGKNITISGGTVEASGTNDSGIYGDNGVTINGGSVEASGTNDSGIYGDNGVTINGGSVTVTSTYGDGIFSYNGNITISGGRVTASGNSSGINTNAGHITLGWTNSTDFIKVSSIHLGADSCTVSIAEGKSFVDENGNEYRGTLTDENLESIKNKTLTPLMPFPDNIVIANISGTTYTGDSIRPGPVVTIGENVLELDKDYTLAYKDNLNASDTAKVIVKGAGKYYGEVQKLFTIDKAPLKVTALNDTIVYGDEPANQGVAYDGFVGNETSEVLKGELALEIGYKQYDDAGKYAITPSGLNADNYEIKFVAGTLNVEPKVISIVWGEQTVFAYDGMEHVPTITADGFVEGHEASLVVTGATSDAGEHTAKVAFDENDANSKNYKLPATGLEKEFKIVMPIAYIDENGVEQTVTDYTVLTSNVTDYIENGVINLPGGWYVVEGEVKYTNQVTFNGEAHLILVDGATMVIETGDEYGIYASNNLTIYGQNEQREQCGTLNVTATGTNGYGIYGRGDVTISGGSVTATGENGDGIYGYKGVSISGGSVTATGENGYGIYGRGDVTISGGTVTAISADGYGICGYKGVSISGGSVTATGTNGDGIYGRGNVTISGGSVTATGTNGDGIYSYSGHITLGWTNSTDFIYASSYYSKNGVSIAEGKSFKDENGKAYSGTIVDVSDIAGKTLVSSSFNGKFLSDVNVAVADIPVQKYADGEPVCPSVVVTDGKDTLNAGTDYTVVCSNNTAVTSATLDEAAIAQITGKGNYAGEIQKRFFIWNNIRDYAAVQVFKDADGNTHAEIDGAYDGTDAVAIDEEVEDVAVKFNREFPKGKYSTTVLPFDVNTENVEGLDAVLRYNGVKTVNGVSSIRMKVVWATDDWVEKNQIKNEHGERAQYKAADLTANTPYLVQMEQENLKVNGGVTLKATAPANVSIDGWTFRGTWEYKVWGPSCSTEGQNCDRETGNAYGFAASSSDENNIKVGDFVKVGEGAWILPMRAYLVSTDILEGTSPAQGVRANGAYVKRPSVMQEELPEFMSIVIDNGDGDDENAEHTTVIGQFNTRTGEIKMNYDRGMFDLKGRRVNGTNNARGAYYGKKVLKK